MLNPTATHLMFMLTLMLTLTLMLMLAARRPYLLLSSRGLRGQIT